MVDLKSWLTDQKLTVRVFALALKAPLKTAQDRVYRGAKPSAENRGRLTDFISSRYAHHWLIEAANGHVSRGLCKLSKDVQEFENSTYTGKLLGDNGLRLADGPSFDHRPDLGLGHF